MLPLIIGSAAILGGAAWLIFGKKDESAAEANPGPGVMTPAREDVLNTALTTVSDPGQLLDLGNAFAQQDLPAQAAQLNQKAADITADPAAAALAAQQIQQQAQATQAASDAATAARAQEAADQNNAAALAAQQADQAAQATAAAAFLAAQNDPSQTIGDQNALGQITGPKVTLQEQINAATESGGGILRAIVGNLPSIQMVLNAVQGINLDVDGKKGPLTAQAIKDFQSSKGLTVDGDPGPQTVNALNAALTG